MSPLEELLRKSLEDFSLSRSEKKALKLMLAGLADEPIEQAKARHSPSKLPLIRWSSCDKFVR